MDCFIHPTAIIDKGAEIGKNSRIWHFSHICSGARIGNSVVLGQNVFVGNKAKIGDNCKIQNNVSIYDNVILENSVFCGPSVVFTNVLNPRAFIERKTEFKRTVVQKGATLGANSTIICGNTIGSFSFVGAGTVVTKDVPDFALIVGNPGKQMGWISVYGERLELPVAGTASAECPHSGDKYKLEGKLLVHKKSQ